MGEKLVPVCCVDDAARVSWWPGIRGSWICNVSVSAPRLPQLPNSATPSAWPRATQWAGAIVLGLLVAFLAGRYVQIGQRTRPTDRERVVIVSPVDLNRAGKAELLQLPGVGDKLADAILAAREQRGGFQRVDDLRTVKGIGPARFDALRPWLTVGWPAQLVSEDLQRPSPPAASPDATARTGKKELATGTRIDVNKASAEELQRLPGVGPVLAARIIAEREKKAFDSAADLRRVSGIGAKTLEKLRPFLTFGAPGDNEVAVVQ